jgi:hypothetical protein
LKVGKTGGGVVDRRFEGPIAIAQEDRDVVRAHVDDGRVRDAVAIEVGHDENGRGGSRQEEARRREGGHIACAGEQRLDGKQAPARMIPAGNNADKEPLIGFAIQMRQELRIARKKSTG